VFCRRPRLPKMPWFMFYSGDWLTDPDLRRCSSAARGVWIDMLCLMDKCEERGALVTGGQPWAQEDVCAAIGGDPSVTLSCVVELLAKGVVQRRYDGALYSRRMFHDEQVRQERAKAGRKGGRPRKQNESKPQSKTKANRKLILYDSDSEDNSESDLLGVTDEGGAGETKSKGVGGKPKADLLALDGLPQDFHTDAFKAAWTAWVETRRDTRHPLTPRAVTIAKNKLTAWGPVKSIEALNNATIGGWQGLFEPKENHGGNNRESDADRRRREQRAKEFPEPIKPLPRL